MRNYFIIIFIIIGQSVSAQFKGGLDNFTILDLRVGGSFPTGSFAQTGQSDLVSGYATPGFNASASAYQSFTDIFGLGGTFSYVINGYDENARRRAIYESNPSVTSVYVESTRYTTFTITGGPDFFIRFSENIGLHLKTEAGLLQTIRPAQRFEITESGNTSVINLDRYGGSSFAVYFGSAIRYHASETVGISLYADYLYGKPNFEYIQYSYPNWITIEGKQQISMINFGFCLSYIVGY
jgi:hypothetical protein